MPPKPLRRGKKKLAIEDDAGLRQLAGFFLNAATSIEEGADPVMVMLDVMDTCVKMVKIARKGG